MSRTGHLDTVLPASFITLIYIEENRRSGNRIYYENLLIMTAKKVVEEIENDKTLFELDILCPKKLVKVLFK